ncbi:MAG: sigma factor-like helix-turn-helix DNA-binding protein, partial [Planctomycetota bacterium]|nr:sigma factor-like helix-turn-helix DNA-binding protein [Planctomycetota bacterium]
IPRVAPWRAALSPPRNLRPRATRIADDERIVLVARHGWTGALPQTIEQLGRRLDRSESEVARLEREALRALRRLRRESHGADDPR